jgi:hypothetical protein
MKPTKFVLCIDDGGAPESLERRKFYEVLADAAARKDGMLRVIDESGEDYLYPQSYFVAVALPRKVEDYLKEPGAPDSR